MNAKRYTVGTAGSAVVILIDGRTAVATRDERQPLARENIAELVAQANAARELADALRALKSNVDVSTIRPSNYVAGRWIELVGRADEALRKFEGAQ